MRDSVLQLIAVCCSVLLSACAQSVCANMCLSICLPSLRVCMCVCLCVCVCGCVCVYRCQRCALGCCCYLRFHPSLTIFLCLSMPLYVYWNCHTATPLQHTATHCNTLQHTATHCNTLQHAAPHCTTLQHTATQALTASAAAAEAARKLGVPTAAAGGSLLYEAPCVMLGLSFIFMFIFFFDSENPTVILLFAVLQWVAVCCNVLLRIV